MSTKASRVPRTKKADDLPVEVAPTSDVQPAEVQSQVAQPEPVKHKKQDAGITPARVRTHIDKFNLNKHLDVEILKLKNEMVNQVAESPEHKELSDKVTALSKERVRFSNDASVVLSIVCEELTEQLLRFTMDKTIELNMGKNIKVTTMYSSELEQLSLYPLIRTLPMYLNKKQKFDKQYQDELLKNEIRVAVSTAEKEFKKLHDIKSAKKRPVEATAVDDATKVVKVVKKVEKDLSTKTSFKTCVNHVYKSLKERSGDKYEHLILSSDFKNYLSELLVEFIRRLSSHIYLMITTMKNKTVNDTITLKTVELLLIDMHQPNVSFELKLVDDKYEAERTVTYPLSGFSELKQVVDTKREKVKAELEATPEEAV